MILMFALQMVMEKNPNRIEWCAISVTVIDTEKKITENTRQIG